MTAPKMFEGDNASGDYVPAHVRWDDMPDAASLGGSLRLVAARLAVDAFEARDRMVYACVRREDPCSDEVNAMWRRLDEAILLLTKLSLEVDVVEQAARDLQERQAKEH